MSKPLSLPSLPPSPTPTAFRAEQRTPKSLAPANVPERAAQTEAIAALRPRIMKLAGRLTGNKFDADDLTQNALVRAIEKQGSYVDGNLGGWVAVMAYREFYNAKRAERETSMDPSILVTLGGSTEPNQYHSVRLNELLTYIDDNMPPHQVDALIGLSGDNYKTTQYRWLGRKKLKAFDV